jgi:hypothetical protein
MLKLNVGFSRKVGEAHYGSRGASVNLELELDPALTEDRERLQERMRRLFILAKESVEAELRVRSERSGHSRNNNSNGDGSRNRINGDGQSSAPRQATQSQARAIHAIAERLGLALEDRLREQFGVESPEQLTLPQASQLIDELKGHDGSAAPSSRGRR